MVGQVRFHINTFARAHTHCRPFRLQSRSFAACLIPPEPLFVGNAVCTSHEKERGGQIRDLALCVQVNKSHWTQWTTSPFRGKKSTLSLWGGAECRQETAVSKKRACTHALWLSGNTTGSTSQDLFVEESRHNDLQTKRAGQKSGCQRCDVVSWSGISWETSKERGKLKRNKEGCMWLR